MNTQIRGAVRRTEDQRLVTGSAKYTEDLQLPGTLHAAFVRAAVAHGRIVGIDTEEARTAPGVVGVYSAADLELGTLPDGGTGAVFARPVLARDRVRFLGEPVAVVVAETREQAVDAAELVSVDLDPLPVVTDPEAALEPDAPLLFPEHGSNVVVEESSQGPAPELDTAEVVVRGRFVNQRLNPMPMEPQAAVAAPDPETGGATLWVPCQAPFLARDAISGALGLDKEKLRVVAPAVGGGFGSRVNSYPEQVVTVALALRLGRPVRYVESRSETMLSLGHGRAQIQYVELGATRDGVITDLKVRVVADCGAYPADAVLMPTMTRNMAAGVYKIPRIGFSHVCVLTNTTPIVAYRGAGRPEATAMLERVVDMLAAELGMDPAEVRRRNLITADTFPHTTATGAVYDSGNYEAALDRALEAAGYKDLRAEQAERRRRGDRRQLGIGLSTYVEMTGLPMPEYGRCTVEPDGSVTVLTGTSPHGQGHETAFAQIVAGQLGVPLDAIRVVHSDTAKLPRSIGTFASRSLQVGGSAVFNASQAVLDKARKLAAHLLEAPVEDITVFPGEGLGVAGAPETAIPWARLATAAADPAQLPEGMDPGLSAETDFSLGGITYPFGAHVAVVEVDTETGEARLLRHVAVDDSGLILNPLLAEGQIHGGLAQGIAQALFEEARYDQEGNLVSGTLATYAMPSAAELPRFETFNTETPSPLNPLQAKGIGESGAIGSTPAVQNAVIDALAHLGVRHLDMPLTPQRIWQAIQPAPAAT
jgi:carbon-monoxide dehydrogenase large subunit